MNAFQNFFLTLLGPDGNATELTLLQISLRGFVIFALGAFKSHAFGKLIKGSAHTLMHDGEIDWREMRRCLVSRHDLEEDLHLDAKTEDVSEIQTARLERSGDISFIKKKQTSD